MNKVKNKTKLAVRTINRILKNYDIL